MFFSIYKYLDGWATTGTLQATVLQDYNAQVVNSVTLLLLYPIIAQYKLINQYGDNQLEPINFLEIDQLGRRYSI